MIFLSTPPDQTLNAPRIASWISPILRASPACREPFPLLLGPRNDPRRVRGELLDLPVPSFQKTVLGNDQNASSGMVHQWRRRGRPVPARQLTGVFPRADFNRPCLIRGPRSVDTLSTVFLLKSPWVFLWINARSSAPRASFRFPTSKAYSWPGWWKYVFCYLQVCHWICFAHKIFILTLFLSIQISLDSYLWALHVRSNISLVWNFLILL